MVKQSSNLHGCTLRTFPGPCPLPSQLRGAVAPVRTPSCSHLTYGFSHKTIPGVPLPRLWEGGSPLHSEQKRVCSPAAPDGLTPHPLPLELTPRPAHPRPLPSRVCLTFSVASCLSFLNTSLDCHLGQRALRAAD